MKLLIDKASLSALRYCKSVTICEIDPEDMRYLGVKEKPKRKSNGFLAKMSKLVLQMVKKRYFKSTERDEIAHVMSWMLGCTEIGLLSPKGWEIRYYDRIEDKNCPYLKEQFPKSWLLWLDIMK